MTSDENGTTHETGGRPAWEQVAAALVEDREPDTGDGVAPDRGEEDRPGAVPGAPDPGAGVGGEAEAADPGPPGGWAQVGLALDDPAGGPGTAAGAGTQGPARRVTAGLRRAWRTRWGRGVFAAALAAVVAGGVWGGLSWSAGLPGDAAFSVNGQIVTVSQLDNRIQVLGGLYGTQPPPVKDAAAHTTFLRTAAKALAVSRVLDGVAATRGVQVPQKVARDTLNRYVSQQYGGSFPKFVKALGAHGLSENDVLSEISHQLVVQKLFTQVVGHPHVSQAQVRRFFQAHRRQLATPQSRQLSHIVVATKAQARSVMGRLATGASFSGLAKQVSLDASTKDNGGVLGTLSRTQLDAPFGTAAFAARPGVPFGPVKDQFGWHVGLVTKVFPGHPATLTARIRTGLTQRLVAQAELRRWDRWLGRQITAAHITYAPQYRPAHPDAPPPVRLPSLSQLAQPGSPGNAPAAPPPPGARPAPHPGATSPRTGNRP